MAVSIAREVAALSSLSFDELKARWRVLHSTEPPAYNRKHLMSRLAHSLQESAYGGLSGSARQKMESVLKDRAPDEQGLGIPSRRKHRLPVAGATFQREWNGLHHAVEAVEGGFLYEDRKYRSLTAVAKEITGTHWNGRAFFALSKTHTKRKRGAKES